MAEYVVFVSFPILTTLACEVPHSYNTQIPSDNNCWRFFRNTVLLDFDFQLKPYRNLIISFVILARMTFMFDFPGVR